MEADVTESRAGARDGAALGAARRQTGAARARPAGLWGFVRHCRFLLLPFFNLFLFPDSQGFLVVFLLVVDQLRAGRGWLAVMSAVAVAVVVAVVTARGDAVLHLQAHHFLAADVVLHKSLVYRQL